MITGSALSRRVWYAGIEIKLQESLDVINHSPTGFSWGYCGSGPAQLALAILLLYLKPAQAKLYHQRFKNDVISRSPGGTDLYLPIKNVRAWIKENVPESRIDEEVASPSVVLHTGLPPLPAHLQPKPAVV